VERVAEHGVEAWQQVVPRRTLDVWFDSGVTHELVLKKRFGRKADLYLEGSDQHRGWFQSSLLTAVASGEAAPYKAVLTHGFVVDGEGHKYSKSSGNFQSMSKLLAAHSPDVLRLWVLQQDFTKELKFAPQSLKTTSERYRRLRNTLRFCLQNTADFDLACDVPLVEPLHQATMAELENLVAEVRTASEAYDFAKVVSLLVLFCEKVSSGYFVAVKDALYCEAPHSAARQQAQFVLGRLLDTFMRLLSPVLPFTAEEVFQLVRGSMKLREVSVTQLTLATLRLPVTQQGREALHCYDELERVKREFCRDVEALRMAGTSVEAGAQEVSVFLSPQTMAQGDAARYLGAARVFAGEGPPRYVSMKHAGLASCPRCRSYRVPSPQLCERCEQVEAA
jgi:isoleucyl-tRNA synthetase